MHSTRSNWPRNHSAMPIPCWFKMFFNFFIKPRDSTAIFIGCCRVACNLFDQLYELRKIIFLQPVDLRIRHPFRSLSLFSIEQQNTRKYTEDKDQMALEYQRHPLLTLSRPLNRRASRNGCRRLNEGRAKWWMEYFDLLRKLIRDFQIMRWF